MKQNTNHPEESLKGQVSSLYEMMKSEHLDELEIKEKDFYLYIKRKTAQDAVQTTVQAPIAVSQPQTKASEAAAEPVVSGLTIKSPIIGVYYSAPSPTSPIFVKEGDVVAAGKTLCIVEAMKVMNEIKAEYSLKILKILVENGKPITANQDLFVIEKA